MIAIEQLVARTFATRNTVHLAHWRETSGYRHETLGALYEDLVSGVDAVVEAYQGAFDVIGQVTLDQPPVADVVGQLQEDVAWIGQNRQAITKDLPAIDNLLQELEGVYLKALYKLRRLS